MLLTNNILEHPVISPLKLNVVEHRPQRDYFLTHYIRVKNKSNNVFNSATFSTLF